VIILEILFWASLGAILWTHVGYPLFVTALAAVRRKRVAKEDIAPTVAVVVAAHNEEAVIGRLVESLLAQDYPGELEVVVASDASTDGMDAVVEQIAQRDGRVRLVRCPRGGKVAAQNLAVRTVGADVVAFADAGAVWEPAALRKLVRSLADPHVGYVAGKVSFGVPEGTNREGLYWRYELWLRGRESAAGSITGGNGAIYALRRADYVEVDPRFGHDLSFPYLMVQRGRRAVYEPEANAFEKATPTTEDEYRRKVRMFEHCWAIVVEGRMLHRLRPLYLVEIVSHRHLRYASGVLHLVALALSVVLLGQGVIYGVTLGLQLGLLLAALFGVGIARYYVLVTWATVVALWNYARRGVPATWEIAEGTR
jgi:cellulose synthase/poly-beta-1,6-N-acetylglucosamine synthase-like glycosyltransferase